MDRKHLLTGHLLALFVSVVWGTAFVSTKVLLSGGSNPLEIMVYRFALAWLVMFLLSPRPLLPKSFRSELPFVLAGLTGLTLYFMLQNYAISMAYASMVGIIISAAPMFTALALWLSRRAPRPGWTFFLGFALSMAGIVLISVVNGEELGLDPMGSVLALGAAVCWGVYGIFVEVCHQQGEYTDLQSTRKMFFWGLLFTIPFVFINHAELSLAHYASLPMIFNLLCLGLGASALCFVAWNKATVLIGSLATNIYIYLMPVITLLVSALVLGEAITPAAVGAVALILVGLWLSERKTSRSVDGK